MTDLADLSTEPRTSAPTETIRLIPSQYPPIGAFDDVTSAEDLQAVMDLEGWTNDRLAGPRLTQLPREDWVFGRPNASVIMAAFLHGSPGGLRFSSATLGAWYASTALMTAVLEVANGLRKELSLTERPRLTQTFREYTARLEGAYLDIHGRCPQHHDPDDASYPTPQALGQRVRDDGPALGLNGIRYESVRRPGHDNWVCFRPRAVTEVMQRRHFELDVPATGKVAVRTL